jgi:hypothetical protein
MNSTIASDHPWGMVKEVAMVFQGLEPLSMLIGMRL